MLVLTLELIYMDYICSVIIASQCPFAKIRCVTVRVTAISVMHFA